MLIIFAEKSVAYKSTDCLVNIQMSGLGGFMKHLFFIVTLIISMSSFAVDSSDFKFTVMKAVKSKTELRDITLNNKKLILNLGKNEPEKRSILKEHLIKNRNGLISIYHQCSKEIKSIEANLKKLKLSKEDISLGKSGVKMLKLIQESMKVSIGEVDYFAKKWNLKLQV